MPSKKLNARKGQILFLLSGIHSQIIMLANLIDRYLLEQAKSENMIEHLTPAQVFFLQRLASSLKSIYKVLTPWIDNYKNNSGLIADSSKLK